MPVTHAKLHRLAITVTDVDTSIPWYESVFGVQHRMDVPHEGGVGKVLGTDAMDLILVLHHHDGNDGGHFAEQATGLDHAGFVVPTRHDLLAWLDHLEANGVMRSAHADKPLTQSPIADQLYASVLVFRDPDKHPTGAVRVRRPLKLRNNARHEPCFVDHDPNRSGWWAVRTAAQGA